MSTLREKIAQLRNVKGRTEAEAELYIEKAAELEQQLKAELEIDDKIAQGRVLTEREKMMHRRAQWHYDRAIEYLRTLRMYSGVNSYFTPRDTHIAMVRNRFKGLTNDPNKAFSEFIGHLCATDSQFKTMWNTITKDERREWRRKNWDENLLS